MIGLGVLLAGVVLAVAGAIVLFGAVAAIAAGLLLIVAGILVDWEVMRGKHPAPPSI